MRCSHGPMGIKEIAERVAAFAHTIATELRKAGFELSCGNYFDTIEILNADVELVKERALECGINFYYPDNNRVLISFDELTTVEEADEILEIFGCNLTETPAIVLYNGFMRRESEILQESIFNRYHSETDMMRYIKKLEKRDISLTQSMIPLGSCTMKLNAAVEMMPLSWSEFTNIHPFVPGNQAEGYLYMIKDLERDLAAITGFAACSLQPNSGAAGEYAGLMTIRAYRMANGQTDRNIAIIPTSAHGTNPASAAMAGMEIVLVSCDENGNINVDELREKAVAHKERLSCLMITYPSTHGVFEKKIREIISIIHENGGLVYMDGANMNAQVGVTNPGFIGADICHLNLHKTFAMPHGGGGPGVGPICATKELAPYLPCHPFLSECGSQGVKAVSSTPYGYPLLLPVTYAYIKLLGAEGLRKATAVAILNANYMSARLAKNGFSTLYTGENGRVAHECIIDVRHYVKDYGIDAGDISKRLMDFGFHAPTLSFPVHETLMIEPTESEPRAELDRFIDAMISIKAECEDIKAGKIAAADSALKNAPHTAPEVCATEWNHKYSREYAAYPLEWVKENKFWPYVARVDNGYGDRNLVCNCDAWPSKL